MVKAIEKKIHEAIKLEPEITKYLKKLGKKYNGKLEGLNYKFKGREKLYEKAYVKNIDNIRDLLRYTFVFKDSDYTEGVYHIYSELEKNKMFKTKHSWIKQKWCLGDMYQGINTSWEYKSFIFELQFHTKISHKMKTTGILHDLYDKYNSVGCENIYINSSVYKKHKCHKMRIKMNKIEDSIPAPPELVGENCGLDISDWYKIIRRNRENTKNNSKNNTNKNSKKRSKKNSKKRLKKNARNEKRKETNRKKYNKHKRTKKK